MMHIAVKGTVLIVTFAAFTATARTGTVAGSDRAYSYGIGHEWTALANPCLLGGYAPAATRPVNRHTALVTTGSGSSSHPAATPNYGGLSPNDSQNGFALTRGAAWFNSQFAQGNLDEFDYEHTGAETTPDGTGSRHIDAGALHSLPDPDSSLGGAGNTGLDGGLAEFGSGAALGSSATGAGGLGGGVMNHPAQAQLVNLGPAGQTVPENGATFPLLGASVLGLVAASRGFRKLVA